MFLKYTSLISDGKCVFLVVRCQNLGAQKHVDQGAERNQELHFTLAAMNVSLVQKEKYPIQPVYFMVLCKILCKHQTCV